MSDEARINKPKVTAAAAAAPTQSGSVIVSHFGAARGNGVILRDADRCSRSVFNTPCVCLTWSERDVMSSIKTTQSRSVLGEAKC